MCPLIGISLGVLCHYYLGRRFWDEPFFTRTGMLLLPVEFFSPLLFAYFFTWLATLRIVIEAVAILRTRIGPFVRPLSLGGLAGLVTALPYIGFIWVHAIEFKRGYFIFLGGGYAILP